MTPERRHRFTVRPNGALFDELVMRDYERQIERRAARPTVARLSREDAEIAAFEATTRGSRAGR